MSVDKPLLQKELIDSLAICNLELLDLYVRLGLPASAQEDLILGAKRANAEIGALCARAFPEPGMRIKAGEWVLACMGSMLRMSKRLAEMANQDEALAALDECAAKYE